MREAEVSSEVDLLDEGFVEEDEEWTSPVTKILQLPFDHESWQHANELLEPPSPRSRKVADEARSIAARHIIDRLQEEDLLSKINKVAPRLRSAVELLSKPDGDYVYPKFQFVVNELRRKYPEVYNSVMDKVEIKIPTDMKPSTVLVSLAKQTVENNFGQLEMDWGKFVALLGLAGALAIDSVKAGYPEGVAEVVEAFGVIVEQVLGEWILSDGGGGGWEGFIELNVYTAKLPPIPRTVIIVTALSLIFIFSSFLFYWGVVELGTSVGLFQGHGPTLPTQKWWGIYPWLYSTITSNNDNQCLSPKNPLQYLFMIDNQ